MSSDLDRLLDSIDLSSRFELHSGGQPSQIDPSHSSAIGVHSRESGLAPANLQARCQKLAAVAIEMDAIAGAAADLEMIHVDLIFEEEYLAECDLEASRITSYVYCRSALTSRHSVISKCY